MRLTMLAAAAAWLAVMSCGHAQSEKVSLDLSAQRPMIRFEIPGQDPALAIFDTGAGGNGLDRPFAAAAGLPNEQPVRIGSGAGGEPIEGYLTTIDTMIVGNVTLNEVSAAVFDLPKPPGHEEIAGVLGPGIFNGRYVTFDFKSEMLWLHEKGGDYVTAGEEKAYTEGPRPLPAIPVTIAGKTYDAHIDTGAPRTLVFPYEMAGELPLEGDLMDNGVAHVVTGARKLYKGKIKGVVDVGPLRLEDPEVEFLEGLRAVNVGMNLLRQLSFTLDPEENWLWIAAAE